MKRRKPGPLADLRRRRGRPVRRARRPEDARPAGGRAEPRREGPRQALGRRHLAGEARRARRRPRRQEDRARAPDGPLPAAGPPRAVGHLRGHEPARALEERRRAGGARRALRRAPRPAHRAHAAHRRHQAPGADARDLHRPLSAAAVPDRPHHPGRLGPAHAGRREQARRRREPHDHQARAAAPHQPGGRTSPTRQLGDLVRARPGLRPRRGQHRLRGPREDRRDPEGSSTPPARAAGREGRSACSST